jgi:hypothetical protein
MRELVHWSDEDLEEFLRRKWGGLDPAMINPGTAPASLRLVARLTPIANYLLRFLGNREVHHS